MRTIHKYLVGVRSVTVLMLPTLARVVLAGLDPETGGPAIWVELDPEAPKVDRAFLIQKTGCHIDGDGGWPSDIHVGSMVDREFVWHVYERRQGQWN